MVDLEGFETFVKGVSTRSRKPTVTLQRRGVMSFNPAAYEALGSPEGVELLFNAARKMIAVRPVKPEEVSHAVLFRGVGGKSASKNGAMLLAAISFCQTFEIDTSESVRRDVEVTDGVLFVDLNDPGVVIRGNRSAKKDGIDDAGEPQRHRRPGATAGAEHS
mgnify:FL=1